MTKKMSTEDIENAADELESYMWNVETIYARYILPLQRKLLKAKLSAITGDYERTKAEEMFLDIVKQAALMYKQELGNCCSGPFTASVCRKVTKSLCDDFEESAIRGELAWLIIGSNLLWSEKER